MLKTKLDLAAVGGAAAVAPALAKVRAAFAKERLDDRDGIRIDLADGWVHLRASNTEPIVRVIAEAPTRERAERLVADCRAAAGL
jgi:phosphomannomutase